MWTKEFWKQTAERAVKTGAQAFVTLATATQWFDVFHADWNQIAGVSVGAAIVSVATSMGSDVVKVGEPNSPSLVK
jgi:hypothetical protein